MKGLKHSLFRGPAAQQEVFRMDLAFDQTNDITGVDAAVDAGSFVLSHLINSEDP